MFRIYICLCSMFFVTQVWAQDDFNSEILSDLYILENADVLTPSYWPGTIEFEVVGSTPPQLGFEAASRVRFLSDSSETKFVMVGEVDNWFVPRASIGSDANYVIIFDKFKNAGSKKKYKISIGDGDIDIAVEDARQEVRGLLSGGLHRRLPGCFSSWRASKKNEIYGFVMFVDTESSEQQQRDCIESAVLSSFGIAPTYPVVSFSDWTFPKIGGAGQFIDESQALLMLGVSVFCRNRIENNSTYCASSLAASIYNEYTNILYGVN